MEDKKSHTYASLNFLNKMIQKIAPLAKPGERVAIRIAIFFTLTTLPVIIITAFEGTLYGELVKLPFIKDMEALSCLFVVIPFLVYIEKYLGPTFDSFLIQARSQISPGEIGKFDKYLSGYLRFLNSGIIEIALICIIYILTVFIAGKSPDSLNNWLHDFGNIEKFSIAGAWFVYISIPVYQFLFIRWILYWFVWISMIVRISYLKWNLNSMHADRIAGLEFLNFIPFLYTVFSIALGINLATKIYMDIKYLDAALADFHVIIFLFIVLIPLFFYFPLIVFIPKMIAVRVDGTIRFGSLIQKHHSYFSEKWFDKSDEETKAILGSTDPSSMSDINTSYDATLGMRIIPVDFKLFIISIIIQLLPFIPLIVTVYSFRELIEMLLNSIIK